MDERQLKLYKTVYLAGLLHDIGKFLNRIETEDQEEKGKHPEIGREFLFGKESFRNLFKTFDINLLETLVKRHHTSNYPESLLAQKAPEADRSFALLVSKADDFSSSERGETAEGRKILYKIRPLDSIFYNIHLDKKAQQHNKLLANIPKYHLQVYVPSKTFPDPALKELEEGAYNKLVKSFKRSIEIIAEKLDSSNSEKVYAVLYNLLLNYTWCVPSSTQEKETDISLFDHLKTTSAISACLFQYHLNELYNLSQDKLNDYETQKFVLLMGDLSGIQDYIFSLAKVGAGAISKRLRSRSFKLTMISYWVSYKILKEFDLPYANLISASGGNFVILLPNLPDTNEKLEKIQKEIDNLLIAHYSGEIALHLAWVPFAGKQFSQTELPKLLEQVHSKLKIKKNQPFYKILVQNASWNEGNFIFPRVIDSEEKICVICRKYPGEPDPGEDNQRVCESCKADRELGTKLVNAKGVAFYDMKPNAQKGFSILDGLFVPLTDISDTPGEPLFILSFKPTCIKTNLKAPVFPMLIANHIPKADSNNFCNQCNNVESCEIEEKPLKENQNLLFECIAQKAKGRKYLAMLKADVDNLGELFRQGLKSNGSISRFATLSRMLDLFFCGWIQGKIKKEYPFLYVVYSGGDDLMIIGPWDQVVEFSQGLRDDFTCFTGANPDFHFSASITIATPHTPVNFIARKADEMLDLAKHKDEEKDKLSALGDLIKWEKVSPALRESKKLANWINNDIISVSFVRNLLYYSYLFDQYKETNKADYLRFIPLLTYDIARNLPPLDDTDTERQEVRKWAEKLKNQAIEQRGELIERLKFIARYALLEGFGKRSPE